MLQVDQLHQYYGGSHILRGLSFDVNIGEVTCLLGRNGVGKTSTIKAVMGLIGRSGTIELAGRDISALPTHRVAQLGVGYVPEDREVFSGLTVTENLRLAERKGGEHRYDLVYELFPELKERGQQAAAGARQHPSDQDASAGQQQLPTRRRGERGRHEDHGGASGRFRGRLPAEYQGHEVHDRRGVEHGQPE